MFDDLFYEIEIDPGSVSAAQETVPPPQKIGPPVRDEIREIFFAMREIGRARRSPFVNPTKFYNEVTRLENARVFYKQAVFMQNFEDDYAGAAAFSSYFPYYQQMSYEQLRTYFTWRANVRKGQVADTSLSYAFLYIYELLNNIGVDGPADGLNKLTAFRDVFSAYDDTVNKYAAKWLKDYHIYYDLPLPAFDGFDLYCAISSYDIRKSAFYNDGTSGLVRDCFDFVLDRLRAYGFEEAVFRSGKKEAAWVPFKSALFHEWLRQPDRRVVISASEIYICRQNRWSVSAAGDKKLAGYAMKRMESALREVTKYKHKLTANADGISLPFEKPIRDAVQEFYREATKTVVTVDRAALSRIRREALATQEKLAVEETQASPVGLPPVPPPPAEEPELPTDGWAGLRAALEGPELCLLAAILRGETDLKRLADETGAMLEVLAGGINEKAADHIGDSILDDELSIYEDYIEDVKGVAGP